MPEDPLFIDYDDEDDAEFPLPAEEDPPALPEMVLANPAPNLDAQRIRAWIDNINAPDPFPGPNELVRRQNEEILARRREVRIQQEMERIGRLQQEVEKREEMSGLRNVKPVDLDGVGKSRISRIYRIGVEMEGLWDKVPDGLRVERDGSVIFEDNANPRAAIGEIPSPPLELDKWEEWVRKSYPTRINKTCGMHVHLSVKSALTYQRLMTPTYPSTIISEFRKWGNRIELPKDHQLWSRLDGKSEYCKHQFTADDQVINADKDFNKERKGNRYTVVNYCWGRTQTAECRLLPAMPSVDIAVSAIRELINITDKFLLATAKKETKHRAEGLESQKVVKEVRDIRVRMR